MNAADNNGKTALHWAAAVNNYEAADILVKCGANRDIQDNKVCVNLCYNVKICLRCAVDTIS